MGPKKEKKSSSLPKSPKLSKQNQKSLPNEKNSEDTSSTRAQDDTSTNTSKGTRVCIKNIPLSFTEDKLRQHLQSSSKLNLIVTDCKILKTKDGKSRKLAFVGFKDSEVCPNSRQSPYSFE